MNQSPVRGNIEMLFKNFSTCESNYIFQVFSSNAVQIREQKLLLRSKHIFTKRLLSSDPCHSIIGHFFFSSVTNWFKTLEFTT